jgi:hypothetical protein
MTAEAASLPRPDHPWIQGDEAFVKVNGEMVYQHCVAGQL